MFAIGRRDEQEKLEELEGTYKDKLCTFVMILVMQNAVTWISEQTFASGCQNAPRITLWDLNGKICQKYLYEVDKNRDAFQFQVNRLAWFSTLKTIAAGCEDNYIRLFDYNQGKLIKKLSMTASVGALSLRNNYQIVAGCQDSSFSIWDIRNCK